MEAFDYAALEAAGFETVIVEYNGSGDEGWIESVTPMKGDVELDIEHELEQTIERQAYDVLESHWPGWEINEGSSGTIAIDVKARKSELKHGENVQSVNWSSSEV